MAATCGPRSNATSRWQPTLFNNGYEARFSPAGQAPTESSSREAIPTASYMLQFKSPVAAIPAPTKTTPTIQFCPHPPSNAAPSNGALAGKKGAHV